MTSDAIESINRDSSSADDGRVTLLTLTAKGRRALRKNSTLDPKRLSAALEQMAAKDQADLVRLLDELARTAERGACDA